MRGMGRAKEKILNGIRKDSEHAHIWVGRLCGAQAPSVSMRCDVARLVCEALRDGTSLCQHHHAGVSGNVSLQVLALDPKSISET